jgi:hypothetical protein
LPQVIGALRAAGDHRRETCLEDRPRCGAACQEIDKASFVGAPFNLSGGGEEAPGRSTRKNSRDKVVKVPAREAGCVRERLPFL